ncbi:MAG TPA: HAMP domain-containing histidine kinase, partial [Caldithrix sp.]|nr:HAMP domain-containing histidine kinase [Caldithrix sp.]
RYGPDLLYLNRDNKFFEEKASKLIYSKSGYLSGYNTGLAKLDIEGNGTFDLVVGNADYWSSLLQNQIESLSGITVSIEGVQDTREALGAKIWLWKNQNNDTLKTLSGYYELLPSTGLFSQSEIRPQFTVDQNQYYDIQVRFLNGDEKWIYNIQAGSNIKIQQSSNLLKILLFSGRRFLQFMHIPYIGLEILKFIIFTLIIFLSARFIEFRYRWRVSHTVFYVILLLLFYLSITYILRDSGFIFHFLPFTIIGFVLLVLVGINEPIRISNYIQRQQQEKLKEAGLNLSRTYNDDEALQIFKESLEIIKPHKKLAIYVYNQFGNHLYRKSIQGFSEYEAPVRIMLSLDTVKTVSQDIKLLPGALCFNIFQHINTKNVHAFNLVRKRQFLGIIILMPDALNNQMDGWEDMRYLCLQLAIALDNIRIMQNLREQEKISAIGTFAGGLIHNLKNPIDGLRMIIELLYREIPKTDSRFEYISELHNGIINLKNQLMKSFDFIANRTPLNDNIKVIPWLEHIVQRYLSISKKIEINYKVKEDITIKGDREQLGFALENIIQNAIEAANSDKTVEINVTTAAHDQQLQIQIKDFGTGIADEQINEIFNIFYSTRGTGRGLGLAITQNIIKNHNGCINVESEINKGSIFTIGLPIVTLEG